MSFISLTVAVKHVVGGRNKQVLPQWICLCCNIQFDNMGSVIFLSVGQLGGRERGCSKPQPHSFGRVRLIFFQAVVDMVPIGSCLFYQLWFRIQGLPGLIRKQTGFDLFFLKFLYFSNSYFQVWSNSLKIFKSF